jgi:hypothetical protein
MFGRPHDDFVDYQAFVEAAEAAEQATAWVEPDVLGADSSDSVLHNARLVERVRMLSIVRVNTPSR